MSHDLAIRAAGLARLIHNDARLANLVVEKATGRLLNAGNAQKKRLYYGDAPRRSKSYYPTPALLLMLIMAESDRYERFDERRNVVSAHLTAVRYVKHLVWIASRRNSFHVAVALCRLLFDYSTPETMSIYDPLLTEGEFLKEDYYYRARKRILMREIEQRFPGIVRVQRARAEERFAADPDQESWLEIVRATLEQCTPWGTACPDDPAHLAGSGDDTGAELARLHVLIHPPCFEALVARAGLEPPARRLAMPRFLSENATVGETPARRMTSAGPPA